MELIEKYRDALKKIPSPGCGCHPYVLTVCNYGVMSGLDTGKIFLDLRRSIPSGKRKVSDEEITDAINKALVDHKGGTFTPKTRPKPVVKNGKAALQKISDPGKISDEADLWEASPIRLWEAP